MFNLFGSLGLPSDYYFLFILVRFFKIPPSVPYETDLSDALWSEQIEPPTRIWLGRRRLSEAKTSPVWFSVWEVFRWVELSLFSRVILRILNSSTEKHQTVWPFLALKSTPIGYEPSPPCTETHTESIRSVMRLISVAPTLKMDRRKDRNWTSASGIYFIFLAWKCATNGFKLDVGARLLGTSLWESF